MEVSAYLHASLDTLGIGVCEYDGLHRAVSWNRTFLHLFPEHDGRIHPGESYDDNLRRFYAARLAPEERGELERYVAEGVARHENQTQPFEFIHGGRRLRASSLKSANGNRVRLWQVVEALSPVVIDAEATIPVLEALSYIPDGATILGADDRIIAANDAFRQLYDIPADRTIVGSTLDEVIAEAWRGADPSGALPVPIRNGLRYDGAPLEVELPGERWLRVIARHTGEGIGCFIHADITVGKRQHIELERTQRALREANAELAKLAWTDPLTGLENRRSFMERLEKASQEAAPLALLVVDVDHFKGVNDRFGHLVGDACLGVVARVLGGHADAVRILAGRIGGEEFGLLLTGVDRRAALLVAEAIRAALRSFDWAADIAPELEGVTVSIGICAATAPVSAGALYAGADQALYAAKRGGRDRVELVVLDESEPLRAAS